MNRKQFLKSIVLSLLLLTIAGTYRVRELQVTNYSTVTTAPGCSGAKITNTFIGYVERTNYLIETGIPWSLHDSARRGPSLESNTPFSVSVVAE